MHAAAQLHVQLMQQACQQLVQACQTSTISTPVIQLLDSPRSQAKEETCGVAAGTMRAAAACPSLHRASAPTDTHVRLWVAVEAIQPFNQYAMRAECIVYSCAPGAELCRRSLAGRLVAHIALVETPNSPAAHGFRKALESYTHVIQVLAMIMQRICLQHLACCDLTIHLSEHGHISLASTHDTEHVPAAAQRSKAGAGI